MTRIVGRHPDGSMRRIRIGKTTQGVRCRVADHGHDKLQRIASTYWIRFRIDVCIDIARQATRVPLAYCNSTQIPRRSTVPGIQKGNLVVVEGTTEGESAGGKQWSGGITPGGRFCSVFAFGEHGLIERMFIYLDPDYLSEDKPRFLWNRGDSQRW
jgi:hypothetical protein